MTDDERLVLDRLQLYCRALEGSNSDKDREILRLRKIVAHTSHCPNCGVMQLVRKHDAASCEICKQHGVKP